MEEAAGEPARGDAFRDNPSLGEPPPEDAAARSGAPSAPPEAPPATNASDASLSRRRHLSAVGKLTYPIVLSEFFQNTLPVVDIAFVGQLGKDELGAAALATAWFNLWNTSMM